MESVRDCIKEITKNRSNKSSSKKDELTVMQAMLNDKTYYVDVYDNKSKYGEYCPSEDIREMATSIIASTTKISKEEAAKLADEHTFSKSEASNMIRVGKEFINTYLQTGRKLPLGGRANSNVSLSIKEVPESTKSYPKFIKTSETGEKIYEHPVVPVPGYSSIRVHGSCPSYLK